MMVVACGAMILITSDQSSPISVSATRVRQKPKRSIIRQYSQSLMPKSSSKDQGSFRSSSRLRLQSTTIHITRLNSQQDHAKSLEQTQIEDQR